MISQSSIVQGLLSLGIQQGDTVEVHSSLSSMGYVDGGAQAVISAFMEAVGTSGTILMSAYPISKVMPLTQEDRDMGITWKVKRVPLDSNRRTGMGIIVDEFVKRKDTVLGHGSYPICAWGKDKEKYGEGYAPLYKLNGKVVLLGVGIDRCSSLHLAEDVALPQKIEKYFTLSDRILAKYPQSKWSVGVKEPPGDAWSKVFKWANDQGFVQKVNIGEAMCFSFNIKPLVDEYRKLRKNDPYGLFEVNQKE